MLCSLQPVHSCKRLLSKFTVPGPGPALAAATHRWPGGWHSPCCKSCYGRRCMAHSLPHAVGPAPNALPHAPVLPLQDLRAAVFALRAFNIETGLVGEHVHESNLIPIRMQWWRDAVNSMYGERRPVQHPVVSALSQVCPANELAGDPILCMTGQDSGGRLVQQPVGHPSTLAGPG